MVAYDNPLGDAQDQNAISSRIKIIITKDYPPVFEDDTGTQEAQFKEGPIEGQRPKDLDEAKDPNIESGQETPDKIYYYLLSKLEPFKCHVMSSN